MANESESEGEIVESDGEKATTTQPSVNGTSVNRKLREALSPSPVRSPYSPSRSTHSRDRSRSPYRASRSPRGEKRAREEEHHANKALPDSRRSKVRYDESKSYGGSNRGMKNSNETRHGDFRANGRYDERDEGSRYRGKRNRSPQGHRRNNERYSYGERKKSPNGRRPGDQSNQNRSDKSRRAYTNEQSVPEQNAATLANSRTADRNTEYNATSTEQVLASRGDEEKGPRSDAKTPTTYQRSEANIDSTVSGISATDVDPMDHDGEEPPRPLRTEAISIEERRKRREEIKAKYKGQAAPLLAQALQLDGAPGNSPSHTRTPSQKSDDGGKYLPFENIKRKSDKASGSPIPESPRTPQHDSANGSPPEFTVSNDAELANFNAVAEEKGEGDEPSAADYDPTIHMEEDRRRHGQRQQDESVSGNQHLDATSSDKPIAIAEPAGEESKIPQRNKPAPSDDMFASDDDDDMFAAVASSKAEEKSFKHASTPKAKELDKSLLDNWDDPAGYYRIILDELLDGRYQVKANLGKGMFSSVVRAIDTTTTNLVAIKIIRNNESMVKAGTREMEILQKLADADPDDKKHLIRLNRSFYHKDHLCMVFENLSINLREVLKKFGRDVGINMRAVRSYAQQMFLGLSLLRKCNILHADLKPDNILVNDARNVLKICDLGSAAEASESGDITPYLVSRFYRAPEIILGAPYDFAIDMWSVGCTLFELATGKILFTGRTNNQMLRSIMECRGKFSLKMLKKAEFGTVHFDEQYVNFKSFERDEKTGRDVTRLINFVKPTRDLKTRLLVAAGSGNKPGAKVLPEAELKEINLFADLLDKCLALNPEKRITPAEALKHSFVHRGSGVAARG